MKSNTHGASGFTLVELAVVMVIIGLIIGGIFFGRDLIIAAEVRKEVLQIGRLDLSVNAFRAKYNCLPGDCDSAVEAGLSAGPAYDFNGNGNGKLEITDGTRIDGDELRYFWHHLARSNLLAETIGLPGNVPGVNSPPLALKSQGVAGNIPGGIWFIGTNETASATRLVNNYILTTTSAYSVVSGVFIGMVAYAFDGKMDDGVPTTGRITASNGVMSLVDTGTTYYDSFIAAEIVGAPTCVDADTFVYLATYATPTEQSLCTILIAPNF